MAQDDLIVASGSGAAVRADINNQLAALGSTMKGPNAPPAPLAGMLWIDDDTPSASVWTLKQYDGADWIELGRLDVTNNIWIPVDGVIAWADVASAGTVDLGAQASRNLRITGTTTITGFGTAASGVTRHLRFAAALTLTHNATSLILPGGANIVTTSGDTATGISLGGGNWVVVAFTPSIGLRGVPVVLATATASSSATLDITTGLDDTFDRYELELNDLIPATNDVEAYLRIGTGAGPTWQAGAGGYASSILAIGPSSTALVGKTASFIPLSQVPGGNNGVISISGYGGVRGLIRFYNPEDSVRWFCDIQCSHFAGSGALVSLIGAGFYGAASAITGLRFLFSSGNIASGSIRLLGYRK